MFQQVEQLRLGPLDVVDHDHDRAGRGERLDQAPDRPERLLYRTGRRSAEHTREHIDETLTVGIDGGEQLGDPPACGGGVGLGVVADPGGLAYELCNWRERCLAFAVATDLERR